MAEYAKFPRAFYANGGPRRRYARANAKPGDRALPAASREAAGCPPAILDSSPDGTGLGIWILVAESADDCTYEYGGGIA